jgi:hypothetical protein
MSARCCKPLDVSGRGGNLVGVPYHVRITTTSKDDELALDLAPDQLERRFLTPRLEGRPITIGGRTLAWDEIERIRINETQESSEQLLPGIRDKKTQARLAGRQSLLYLPDDWLVTEEGRDVTDELLTDAVGAHAPVLSETGSWFHVRVGAGSCAKLRSSTCASRRWSRGS